MWRVAVIVTACVVLAGCSLLPVKTAETPPRATVSATASPSPLALAATSPLKVQAAEAPASAGPPAGVQDIVFASASAGWLVTSGQVAYGGPAWAAGVWRTTDGGATWTELWRGWDTRLDRIGLMPGAGELYAAGTRVSAGARSSPLWLTSADGGATWSATEPQVPAIAAPQPGLPTWSSLHFAFPSAQVGYAAIEPEDAPYGPDNIVLATRDGGRTWSSLPLPAGFHALGGLDFPAPDRGWITGSAAGTCDQIWQTRDGGQSWSPMSGTCAPYPLYAVDFVSPERGFAAGGAIPFVGAQTGVLETEDGGTVWRPTYYEKGPASTGPVTHLRFTSAADGWAWGGTCKMGGNGPCPGRVLITRDGGSTWTRSPVSALALSLAGGIAWAQGGYAAGLWRSTDGGTAWQHILPPATARFEGLSTEPGSAGIWLATGAGTFESADGGATWTRAAVPGQAVRVSRSLMFSTGSPNLQVSRDGGGTWQPVALPGETDGVAAVAFATPDQGWALMPAAHCAKDCTVVDRTRDGGRTWTTVGRANLMGLQAMGAFTAKVGVIVSQTEPALAGSYAGIGISRDGGATWRVLTLPSGAACYQPAARASTILVPCQAPDGSGLLLRSADAGTTWHAYTTPALVPEDLVLTDALHGWMLAGGGGPTPAALYRTADGGRSWSQVWPALPGAAR